MKTGRSECNRAEPGRAEATRRGEAGGNFKNSYGMSPKAYGKMLTE